MGEIATHRLVANAADEYSAVLPGFTLDIVRSGAGFGPDIARATARAYYGVLGELPSKSILNGPTPCPQQVRRPTEADTRWRVHGSSVKRSGSSPEREMMRWRSVSGR